MPAPTASALALKADLEAAILGAMENVGPSGLSKATVVRPFTNRGVHLATLYRWFDAIMASGRPSLHMAKRVKAMADERARTTVDPVASVIEEARALVPAPVHVIDAADQAAIPFIARLQACLGHADELLRHAKTADGKIRNAKLVLSASEHVRRTLETAARIQETIMQVEQVERFHQAIFDALRDESPELAERVLIRLRHLNASWGID